MSTTMLQAVLRMPPELWRYDPIDIAQRHSRYVAAADKLQLLDVLVTTHHETKADFINRVRAVLES